MAAGPARTRWCRQRRNPACAQPAWPIVYPPPRQVAATVDRRLALLDKHPRVRVRAWLDKLRQEVPGLLL